MGMTLKDQIMKLQTYKMYEGEDTVYVERDDILKLIEQQPKTGHWIKTGDYYTGAYECLDYFECSCCHEESLEEGDYCPNCGAKMEVKNI